MWRWWHFNFLQNKLSCSIVGCALANRQEVLYINKSINKPFLQYIHQNGVHKASKNVPRNVYVVCLSRSVHYRATDRQAAEKWSLVLVCLVRRHKNSQERMVLHNEDVINTNSDPTIATWGTSVWFQTSMLSATGYFWCRTFFFKPIETI